MNFRAPVLGKTLKKHKNDELTVAYKVPLPIALGLGVKHMKKINGLTKIHFRIKYC